MAQAAKKMRLGSEGVKWDLGDLYSGLDDPRIVKDTENLLKRAKSYEKKYRGKINSGSLTPAKLKSAVKEIEAITEQIGKLLSYAYLVFAADTSTSEHGAFLQKIQETATLARKHLLFFEIEWVSLSDRKVSALLKSPSLARYRHFLLRERRYRPHRLSEPEEMIMDEKANTGGRAFRRLFDELLNNISFKVRLNGRTAALSETETLALLCRKGPHKRACG
jgi:oligoendopeptidase F